MIFSRSAILFKRHRNQQERAPDALPGIIFKIPPFEKGDHQLQLAESIFLHIPLGFYSYLIERCGEIRMIVETQVFIEHDLVAADDQSPQLGTPGKKKVRPDGAIVQDERYTADSKIDESGIWLEV